MGQAVLLSEELGVVCDEDNSDAKPWSAGDSTSIQPDASGDSDTPLIQGLLCHVLCCSAADKASTHGTA